MKRMICRGKEEEMMRRVMIGRYEKKEREKEREGDGGKRGKEEGVREMRGGWESEEVRR